MWTRLVPDEARARATPPTFRASWRALVLELGAPLVYAAGAAALALAAWAAFDVAAARDGYLRAQVFHGHLELAAAALLWTEGALPQRPRA